MTPQNDDRALPHSITPPSFSEKKLGYLSEENIWQCKYSEEETQKKWRDRLKTRKTTKKWEYTAGDF